MSQSALLSDALTRARDARRALAQSRKSEDPQEIFDIGLRASADLDLVILTVGKVLEQMRQESRV